MAIIVGTNSWVTILEADTYLGNKLNATDWFLLNDNPANPGENSKESYLVDAFYKLLYNKSYTLVASLTDDIIKHAQIEFALFLLQNYEDYKERESKIASGIKSFSYSKWRESLGDSIQIPYFIDNMIETGGYGSSNFLQDITVD